MTFAVSGDAYDSFMGRYSRELAPAFADWSGIEARQTVLDVGCGSGILTQELAGRLGGAAVSAIDPSPLVEACAARVPEADVRKGAAEDLPWPDNSFDAALAQLVIHFLDDPAAGLGEMRRVVRAGGVVGVCTWDFPEMRLLRTFWESAREVDPRAPGETLPFATLDSLAELGNEVGLDGVETGSLDVSAAYEDFDELWGSFLLGVGPSGEYCAELSPEKQAAVREEYHRRVGAPSGSFVLTARARALRGRVPGGDG